VFILFQIELISVFLQHTLSRRSETKCLSHIASIYLRLSTFSFVDSWRRTSPTFHITLAQPLLFLESNSICLITSTEERGRRKRGKRWLIVLLTRHGMSLLINDARLSLCSLTRLLPFIVSIKANCRALTLFSLGHLIACEIELSLSVALWRGNGIYVAAFGTLLWFGPFSPADSRWASQTFNWR